MAVTQQLRKARKNKTVSRKRRETIKRLTQKPVLKRIDIEEIKKQFEENKKATAEPKPKKTTKAKAEPKKEEVEATTEVKNEVVETTAEEQKETSEKASEEKTNTQD